jgi:hypothetical protein
LLIRLPQSGAVQSGAAGHARPRCKRVAALAGVVLSGKDDIGFIIVDLPAPAGS